MESIAKVIIGILIVAVVGAGVALATKSWNPNWNPFGLSPDKVLEKTADAQKKIKSSHVKGLVKVNLTELPASTVSEMNIDKIEAEFNFEGDADQSDPDQPKSKMQISGSVSTDGTEFSGKAEMKSSGDVLYGKVSQLPAGSFVPQWADQFEGQWIKFDPSQLQQQTDQEIDSAKLQKEMEKIIDISELLEVKKEFPSEKVGGVTSYHYLVRLNKEETKKEAVEIAEVTKDLNQQAETVDKEEIKKQIDKLFEKAGPLEAELWIGKDKFRIRKLRFEGEFELKELDKEAEGGKLSLVFEAEYSDYGKTVKIKKPDNVKSWQEVMAAIMREMMVPMQPQGEQLPGGTEIPEGTNVPQLPVQDFGGPAFLLQGIF